MEIKTGVYGFIHVALVPVLCEYDYWCRSRGYKNGVLTGGMDGVHSDRSWHYEGRAVDLRTRFLTDEHKQALYAHLREQFAGQGYDVVLENTHIHVEFEGRWSLKEGATNGKR